jgi:DNA-binding NarL/FixJ family response regulator
MPPPDTLESTIVPRRTLGTGANPGLGDGDAGSLEASYEMWTRPLPFGPPLCSKTPLTFSNLWTQLSTTSLRFATSLPTRTGSVLVFRRGRDGIPYTLTAREQQVLHRTLLGRAQKQIALECNIMTSTVSFGLRSAMMKLGFRSRLELVPFAALAASRRGGPGFAIFSAHGGEFVFATSGGVDWTRFGDLTQTDREISEAIIAGRTNHQVAEARATSVGTVHNQVAMLFKKTGARDRFDLVRLLFEACPDGTHRQSHRALQEPQERQPFAPWPFEDGQPAPPSARLCQVEGQCAL